jgi:hypothetical protein
MLEDKLKKNEEELLKSNPIPKQLKRIKQNKNSEAESEYDMVRVSKEPHLQYKSAESDAKEPDMVAVDDEEMDDD